MKAFALLAASMAASTQAVEIYSSGIDKQQLIDDAEAALAAAGDLCCVLFDDAYYQGTTLTGCLEDDSTLEAFFMEDGFSPRSMMCSEGTGFRLSGARSNGRVEENDYEGIYTNYYLPNPPSPMGWMFIQITDRIAYP